MQRLQAATFVAFCCEPDIVWRDIAELLCLGYEPVDFDVSQLVSESRSGILA